MHGMMAPGFLPFEQAIGCMDGTEHKCPRPMRAGQSTHYSGKKCEVRIARWTGLPSLPVAVWSPGFFTPLFCQPRSTRS